MCGPKSRHYGLWGRCLDSLCGLDLWRLLFQCKPQRTKSNVEVLIYLSFRCTPWNLLSRRRQEVVISSWYGSSDQGSNRSRRAAYHLCAILHHSSLHLADSFRCWPSSLLPQTTRRALGNMDTEYRHVLCRQSAQQHGFRLQHLGSSPHHSTKRRQHPYNGRGLHLGQALHAHAK